MNRNDGAVFIAMQDDGEIGIPFLFSSVSARG